MVALISALLALAAGLLGIPVAVFLIEILASLLPEREDHVAHSRLGPRGAVAVVVPAHDEGTGILPTLHDIVPQLGQGDRLLVVADNCTDDTAAIADVAGADVLVRSDLKKIGKGYALAWAIDHLQNDPPAFVLFVDADCRIQPDTISRMKIVCESLGRPIQARYLMLAPPSSPIDHSFAEFAWAIRNWARPLGLKNLGCPTQLMGTGMIFPWDVICAAPLASGHRVEDLKLGLDLAAAGSAAHFFPSAVCTSEFPISAKGTDSQRQRWVGGHIKMILETLPRYLWLAIKGLNFELLVLAFDLAVPPLSLLGMLIAGMFALTLVAWLLGVPATALLIATGNLFAFVLAVLIAWQRFGRNLSADQGLESVGSFFIQKLKLYAQIFLGKAAPGWVRTDRGKTKS